MVLFTQWENHLNHVIGMSDYLNGHFPGDSMTNFSFGTYRKISFSHTKKMCAWNSLQDYFLEIWSNLLLEH
jgi:hypothetical protein